MLKLNFVKVKETKGTFVYEAEVDDAAIKTVYVNKAYARQWLGDKMTIHVEEKAEETS